MDADISVRIQRIHAALGRSIERDLTQLKPLYLQTPKGVLLAQDWSGGQSQAELSEALYSLVANVASFHDHMKHWGRRHSVSGDSIHNYFAHSTDFCIVYDLWNYDKHGASSRNGGWSGKGPKILGARRVMQLRVAGEGKQTAYLTMNPDGTPRVGGNGEVRATLTGEVIDRLGNGIGDAHDFLERSVKLCESALRHFNVQC